MQKAYVQTLYELLKKDKNVISVLSDSGTDYDEMIKQEFPNQCINLGIAEENLVGVASGLAASGKIPYVYTTGAFLAYRAYEFIRDDVCLQKRNVKIIGMGSGLAWSTLGASHHTTEDISALRAIPGLVLLCASTPNELSAMLRFSYYYNGPIYIRIGMSNEKEIYEKYNDFVLGKSNIVREGKNIAIFSTGSILEEIVDAYDKLEKYQIKPLLIDMPCIKPFDNRMVIELAKKYKYFVTIEEHNIFGGIGSVISEVIAENALDVKLLRMGLNDMFAKGYGTQKQVRQQNMLDCASIVNRIKGLVNDEQIQY